MQTRATERPEMEALDEPELVALVRAGDRTAGAEFLRRNREVLRQRIRRRLRRVGKRLFDSQEILATVCRRLDRMVLSGNLEALNPASLMGLLLTIAEHSVVDKARVLNRIRRAEGADSEFANRLRSRIEDGDRTGSTHGDDVIARVFEGLGEQHQREILGLWLRGCPLHSIAEQLGTRPDTLRKQWERIRKRCVVILSTEEDAR